MTPDQEAKANDAANMILAELHAAKTPEECAAISERHAKLFKRLQEVHPVRAIHIVNLASLKKTQFARDAQATKRAAQAQERRAIQAQQDLWK